MYHSNLKFALMVEIGAGSASAPPLSYLFQKKKFYYNLFIRIFEEKKFIQDMQY